MSPRSDRGAPAPHRAGTEAPHRRTRLRGAVITAVDIDRVLRLEAINRRLAACIAEDLSRLETPPRPW